VTRILMFIGTSWAFGSVHHELVKYFHSRGIVADILDWSKAYSQKDFSLMSSYYDYFYGVPGETWPLTDIYGISHDRIVAVAHGDYDLVHMIKTRPADEIDRFAGYAVISEFLRDLSVELGVKRVPKVVRYGINFQRFFAAIPSELKVVGYGGSMHRVDHNGVEWKRGILAQEAAEAAGLSFQPAGNFHFLAMPQYYRQVDAVVVSSLWEGFGLPAMEAAAAGRLVIGTPVGGFPYQCEIGAGIAAPLDAGKFKEFVAERLIYYKQNPGLFSATCKQFREASRLLDWNCVLDDWISLFAKE
jgi:Glycosyl transferases group 1